MDCKIRLTRTAHHQPEQMENVSDQLLAQKKSFSSTVQTDVEHWQRTARELMLKEILPSTDITLRKILVPCSYVVFERDILPVEMIGVRSADFFSNQPLNDFC